jgi:sugar (pentulose or hexulose) kinase
MLSVRASGGHGMTKGLIAALDIGKTNSKLSLLTDDGELVDKIVRPNASQKAEHYTALDVERISQWLESALSVAKKHGPIDAIVPISHGAAAALVVDGALACPIFDYESAIPEEINSAYDIDRDQFVRTGSPRLPNGLNLGAQLAWQQKLYPAVFGNSNAQILLYPQYWAWKLCGVAASEVSSLGCHTDLWVSSRKNFSSLVERRSWRKMFPQLRHAGDVLGPLSDNWVKRCGVTGKLAVHCGIHDSNAALLAVRSLAEFGQTEFSVLSTGTWFVAMRNIGPSQSLAFDQLDPSRDSLTNVDIGGKPVPSARFMGGREIDILLGHFENRLDIAKDQDALITAISYVIDEDIMLLPSFVDNTGPFPEHKGQWLNKPHDRLKMRAAVALYVALITDEMLSLIGSQHKILIEGRFAQSTIFTRLLATLRPSHVIYTSNTELDLAYAATQLVHPGFKLVNKLTKVRSLGLNLYSYRNRWKQRLQSAEVQQSCS